MATPRRFPLIGKALALGAVLIVLVLALESVSGIVAERAGRLREAERSVAASLASVQTLVGPVLERDCSESWEAAQGEGKDRKTVTERRDFKLVVPPATLDITGDAAIEPRYRGIFKVNGDVLKARFVAGWSDGAALVPQAQHAGSRLQCDAPVLFVALGDSRGVRSAAMEIDGAVVPVLAGDDEATLAARVLTQEHLIYPRAIGWLVGSALSVQGGVVRHRDGAAQWLAGAMAPLPR